MRAEDIHSRTEIAQRMRSRSLENNYRMAQNGCRDTAAGEDGYTAGPGRSLARARLLAAVFLVAGVVCLDRWGGRIGSLDADRIFRMIEPDYETILTEKFTALIENCRR